MADTTTKECGQCGEMIDSIDELDGGFCESCNELSPCCSAWTYGDYKICSVCGEHV